VIVREDMGLAEVDRAACIKELIRGARRYQTAAKQDMNPFIAMRHNGYAVALIDAAMNISTEEEVKEITGESLKELRKDILDLQDRHEALALQVARDIKKMGIKLPFEIP